MGISEKVRNFLQDNLMTDNGDHEIRDDDDLFQLGFVDSTFAMELVSFVEVEFNITVTDEDLDLENFSSLNRVVKFVERKTSN